MLTLHDCLVAVPLTTAALHLSNQVAYLPRKGYVTGPNGQTYWDWAARLRRELKTIEKAVRSSIYEFEPCRHRRRRVGKKERDLYTSNWGDRLVERWLNTSLNKLLDSWFSRHSHAYRHRGLGIDSCQYQIGQFLRSGRSVYVVRRDISNFFYSIDHTALLANLSNLVDEDIYKLLKQRIAYDYYPEGSEDVKRATVGVPFGTSIACTLANITLTDLDRKISALDGISYYRYADDFLVLTNDRAAALAAAALIDGGIKSLNLELKPSHKQDLLVGGADDDVFTVTNKFHFLGLEYLYQRGVFLVRLAVEKQRKIVNFFRRHLDRVSCKSSGLDERITAFVAAANGVVEDRIRSAAIIDYYLKHVDDELQLRQLDRLVVELVVSRVLNKPFRNRDFNKVPYARLRAAGLISLVHRHRLHRHGHLHINFLSLRNQLLLERRYELAERRRQRINQLKIANKLKKLEQK